MRLVLPGGCICSSKVILEIYAEVLIFLVIHFATESLSYGNNNEVNSTKQKGMNQL